MPGSFPDAPLPRMVNYMLGPQNHDIDGAEDDLGVFQAVSVATRATQ